MKNKLFPLLCGGITIVTTGVLFKDKILKSLNNIEDSLCSEVTLGCYYLSGYGNMVSLLIRNIRYDVFLEESLPEWDTHEIVVKVKYLQGKLVNIISVNGIKVEGYSENTKQIESVCYLICKDVTNTGLTVLYGGRSYDILLGKGFKIKQPLVEVVVAEDENTFNILSVNGYAVLSWKKHFNLKDDTIDNSKEDLNE